MRCTIDGRDYVVDRSVPVYDFAVVQGVPGGFGQRFAPPKDAVAAGDGFGTAQSDDGDGSARSGGGSDDGIGRCVHRTKIIGGSGS